MSEERTNEIIKGLYDAVVHMDEDKVKELSQAVIDEGIDVNRAVIEGLAAAMARVGELYANKEYFVPELLICSDALYIGLEILKPHIKISVNESNKKIIIGTVEGDIHDIGKNLVRIMFDAAGWEVYDLGKDVKLSRFAEKQKEQKADIVALSALMTTSMLAIPKAIEMIRAVDSEVSILVGGAPLTREIALSYGANGYADNAGRAVQEAIKVLEQAKVNQKK